MTLLCSCFGVVYLTILLHQTLGVFPKEDLSSAARTAEQDSDLIGTQQCERYNKNCDPETTNCEVEECVPPSSTYRNLCYASWSNSSDGVQILSKGCWIGTPECHGKRQCVQRDTDPVRYVYFCCCEGDFCNRNITFRNDVGSSSDKSSTVLPPVLRKGDNAQLTRAVLYSIVPIIGGAVIIVAVFFMWKRHQRHLYLGHQQLPTIEPGFVSTPSETSLNLEKVELIELRARGRFGSVWKAQLLNELVAVKIFPLQDKQSWLTEQEIYNLPQMSHENVLKFITSEKRGENLHIELWLLTEFHEHGSLYDYLKGHVLTWSQLCKIGESMAQGLAFLHDEIPSTTVHGSKPAVAHRDFKSKNVLLKSDLTACVADFGLALKFEPGKGPGETHGLVGTRRYMAPEVLEGAICFNRDAFLRIDMYACGLVLWELLSRCNAAEGPVEEYQLPFENVPEIGLHPTLESMQEYVVSRKMRPPIHEHWKRHPGIMNLVCTVEECWDQDAEARLSAGCVQERIAAIGRTFNVVTVANGVMPPTSQYPPSLPPALQSSGLALGQTPPHSSDSVISFSSSSDIPPKDLSSC